MPLWSVPISLHFRYSVPTFVVHRSTNLRIPYWTVLHPRVMNEEPTQPPSVGWLKFFFEDYLPESPCPPGCRHIHSVWRKQPGSLSSGSPLSSCVGETDDFFADSSSAYTSEDTSNYHKFSPIPMLLEQVPGKLSVSYSDRSTTSSRTSRSPPGYPQDTAHSPPGYPEDGFRGVLSHSEEELKQLDDLISLYSDKLSETESERDSSRKSSRSAAENAEFHCKSPVKAHFSFSEGDIHHYLAKHRPSEVADCLLSNCHCTLNGQLKIEHLLNTSPLDHAQKLARRDVSTQCVFSDIIEFEQLPSPDFTRKCTPTDEDTLTKYRHREPVSPSPSPETCQRSYYSDLDNFSEEEEEETPDLPYLPEPPGPAAELAPPKAGLHVELSTSSSGGKTSSSNDTPHSTNTLSSAVTTSTNASSAVTFSTGESLTAVSPINQPEELAAFPPFVIDFFQFAARPEDYLTDEQLEWYFEVGPYLFLLHPD